MKEKDIRLLRLRHPTAEGGREKRTTGGTDHLMKLCNTNVKGEEDGRSSSQNKEKKLYATILVTHKCTTRATQILRGHLIL